MGSSGSKPTGMPRTSSGKVPAAQKKNRLTASTYTDLGETVFILNKKHKVYMKGTKKFIRFEDGSFMSMKRAIGLQAKQRRAKAA